MKVTIASWVSEPVRVLKNMIDMNPKGTNITYAVGRTWENEYSPLFKEARRQSDIGRVNLKQRRIKPNSGDDAEYEYIAEVR